MNLKQLAAHGPPPPGGKIPGGFGVEHWVVPGSKHSLAAALNSIARLRLKLAILGMFGLAILPALPVPTPVHVAMVPVAGGPWLDRFNAWRAGSGLSALTEDLAWSQGDVNHSIYMVKNNVITHYETVGWPYYTTDGDAAGRNSNIFVSSTTSTTDVQAIDWWMQAPFHAMGMMDPRLTQTGFGSYRDATAQWQMAAAVDVIHGNPFTGGQYPVYFPGNGSTQPLTNYGGGESPDPLQGNCATYSVPTGLPVFVEIGGNVATTAGPVHTFTGNGAPLEHCVLDSNSPNVGSYLTNRGGVVLIPRQPLQTGVNYVATLTVNGLPYTWSFQVGQLATGVPAPPAPPVVPPAGAWSSLNGLFNTGAGSSSWGNSRTDVFAAGADNGLWQDTWNGTAWGPWTPLGGIISAEPGAVSWGTGRIDVFVRGQDGALYHRSSDGTSWANWEGLGGGMKYGPEAASMGPQRLDIFITGNDNQLWHKYGDGLRWSGWEPLGGYLTSGPTVVSWGANRLDIFARGGDGQMWHMAWANRWTGWEPLGGLFNSGADAASCSSAHLDVFAVGGDNALWQLGWNGAAWTGWKPVGGIWTSKPSAVCRPGTTTVDLFARGTDRALWHRTTTGS
ncbi:MAG: hypothetical protein PVSMB3_05900 [Candidatus Dormibacteraceae bacterium]